MSRWSELPDRLQRAIHEPKDLSEMPIGWEVCDEGLSRSWGAKARACLGGAVAGSGALCEVIARETGHPLEQLTPESRIREELGLDFFDLAELVAALESTFSSPIPEELRPAAAATDLKEGSALSRRKRSMSATPRKPRGSGPRVVSIGASHRSEGDGVLRE